MDLPPRSTGAGGGSGWVYIADIDGQGGAPITDKDWQDPAQTILQECTVTSLDITVTVRASYPLVVLDGVEYDLTQSGDGGHYQDAIDITISGAKTLVVTVKDANGIAGASDSTIVNFDAPPSITALSFSGAYPGAQTELKEDDNFNITLTSDKLFDQVEVIDSEAGKSKVIGVGDTTSTTVAIDIADRGNTAVPRPARVRVRDASSGAWSATRDTNFLGGTVNGVDLVLCNDLRPTVIIGAPTYPGAQLALKGSETATVPVTVSNADTADYDSPNSQLSIVNPNETPAFDTIKTVQRIAGGYNISTNNLRCAANRVANDATTTTQRVVQIADEAAQVSIVLPAARLRSGGNDGTSVQNHIITISSNQPLLSTPSMDEDVGGGTFTGSWAGSGDTYTRTLQVHDDDIKGTYNWQNLLATNLAGVVTTAITSGGSYVLGGFVARNLTFASFATTTLANVEVVDFTKLTAVNLTGSAGASAVKYTIGTPPPQVDGWTIQASATKPTTVIWLDTVAAGNNSTGTAQITGLEEAA